MNCISLHNLTRISKYYYLHMIGYILKKIEIIIYMMVQMIK